MFGIARIGVADDFFALGGHSLLATQVISRTRAEFQISLALEDLFMAPTIAGLSDLVLARLLEEEEGGLDDSKSCGRPGRVRAAPRPQFGRV